VAELLCVVEGDLGVIVHLRLDPVTNIRDEGKIYLTIKEKIGISVKVGGRVIDPPTPPKRIN